MTALGCMAKPPVVRGILPFVRRGALIKKEK
jgi:hypothetical protein